MRKDGRDEYMKKYSKKYYESNKVKWKDYRKNQRKYMKKYGKDYNHSERGRFIRSQHVAQTRNLGFVPITEDVPDESYEFHHINHNLVAPLPKELHRLTRNKFSTLEQHRFFCYQIIKQLYGGEKNS